jgi:hypothetical protein
MPACSGFRSSIPRCWRRWARPGTAGRSCVATGDARLYANMLLTIGYITPAAS